MPQARAQGSLELMSVLVPDFLALDCESGDVDNVLGHIPREHITHDASAYQLKGYSRSL